MYGLLFLVGLFRSDELRRSINGQLRSTLIPNRFNVGNKLSAVSLFEDSYFAAWIKAYSWSVAHEYNREVLRTVSIFRIGPHEMGAFCITRYTSVGPLSSEAASILVYMMHWVMNAGGDSHSNPSCRKDWLSYLVLILICQVRPK